MSYYVSDVGGYVGNAVVAALRSDHDEVEIVGSVPAGSAAPAGVQAVAPVSTLRIVHGMCCGMVGMLSFGTSSLCAALFRLGPLKLWSLRLLLPLSSLTWSLRLTRQALSLQVG
jgi:hypothetical protein